MATATALVSNERIEAKPPDPPTLSLQLDRERLGILQEMARLAFSGEAKLKTNIDLAAYASMLLDVQIADFLARKIPSNFLKGVTAKDRAAAKTPVAADNVRRGSLPEADQEKIIVSLLQGVKVDQLAQRWGRGASTIRRVWKKRAPSPEVIQRILHLNSACGDQYIGVPGIAQALGIGQSIVEAVIANYRPLVPASGAIYAHPPRPGGWNRYVSGV
jgi:hypothetical protein